MNGKKQPRVPDVLLERFLSDDLPPESRRRIEAERDASEEVKQRLVELSEERSAFLAADPPAQFAHRVATRLAVENERAAVGAGARSGRRWWFWIMAPSAAAAVTLFAAVSYRNVSQEADQAVWAPAETAPASKARERTAPEEETRPTADPVVVPAALSDDFEGKLGSESKRPSKTESLRGAGPSGRKRSKPRRSAPAAKPAAAPKMKRPSLRSFDMAGEMADEVAAEPEAPAMRAVPPPPRKPTSPSAGASTTSKKADKDRAKVAAFGYLSLVTQPWTDLLIDGKKIGRTPLLKVRLPTGTHEIRLKNPAAGIDVKRKVTIRSGQHHRLDLNLARKKR